MGLAGLSHSDMYVTGGRPHAFAMASGEMTDAEFLAFNEA
jgi:hypothetical protein